MMFEISIGKIFVIFVVALIVLGPEKATNVARLLGYWVGKIKRDINKIKHELDLEKSLNINETIKDIKKEFEVFKEAENDLKEGFNAFEKSFNDYQIEHNPHLFEKIDNNPKKRKMKVSFYSGSKTSSVGKKKERKKKLHLLKRNKNITFVFLFENGCFRIFCKEPIFKNRCLK